MKDYTLSLDYKYVAGKSEYYIDAHEIKNRILPFCVAVSVIEGEYFVDFCDGTTISVKTGETIFIQSFVKHTVRMNATGKLTYAHFLCRYANIDILFLANMNYFVTDNKDVYNLINKLNLRINKNEIVQKLYIDNLLCNLFLVLFNINIIASDKLVVESWLNTALQYIHANFREGITVDEVISVCGCSKTIFYRMFKNRMKVTPHEYIESERFRAASMLLLEGKKVKEAAKAVGFNDISYFNKVFKNKYGVTPIEHKQKMKITVKDDYNETNK